MFQINKCTKIPNPAEKSFISRTFFVWMVKIFLQGRKRTLQQEDIYAPLNKLKSEHLSDRFTKLWQAEGKTAKRPRLLRIFYREYGTQLLILKVFFSIFEAILKVLQPIFLGDLLFYFVPGQVIMSEIDALKSAGALIASTLLLAIMFHPFNFYLTEVGLQINIACCTLIYEKLLKLSKSTVIDGLNGRVLNLMSNDATSVESMIPFIDDLWKGPLEAALIGYFLYREIGPSGLIGLMFFLSFIPLQIWIGRQSASYHLETAKRADTRIKFMNEIIQGIQTIKMYAWENSFAQIVDTIRRFEVKAIRGWSNVRAIIISFSIVSRISIYLCLISYSLYFDEVITARKVFIITFYFLTLHSSMLNFWPRAISEVTGGLVSLKRIEDFLLHTEDKQKVDKILDAKLKKDESNSAIGPLPNIVHSETRIKHFDYKQTGIIMNNVSAVWSHAVSYSGIFSIDLYFRTKMRYAIIGNVGCGKSTLINTILGELKPDKGYVNINGIISYASQKPWLFSGTIRENILFGQTYDENRYRDVCHACSLVKDFDLMSNGDLSLVGESGTSLSGGQKARISLARAVYKNADIYLLDDPLSAVDSQVGKFIFTECIQKYLSDKCVILVTHQLQFLKRVDYIVLLEDGRILDRGPFENLHSSWKETIAKLCSTESKEKCTPKTEVNDDILLDRHCEEEREQQEEMVEGCVKMNVYVNYFKSIKSKTLVFFIGMLFLVSQILLSVIDYLMVQWVNWEESGKTSINSDKIRHRYIAAYSIIISIIICIIIQRNFVFFKLCLRASVNLHDQVFCKISRAKMIFFNTNASGRILNRFTKDIKSVDCLLPMTLIDTIVCSLDIIATILLITIINHWLILPTILLSLVFYCFRTIYVKTSRALNRIQSQNRSPIYSFTNSTIQGLATLKSSNSESIMRTGFQEHLNHYTGSIHMYHATTRAIALWLDALCAIYVAIITLACIFISKNSEAGDIGFIISKAILLIKLSQWALRQSAELENNMISTERLIEYCKLDEEPPLESPPDNSLKNEWPELGAIAFNDLSLKYSNEQDYILNKICFKVNPNEKIGIVGRTGAGKSSIIQALFRLTEFEGIIQIDEVDIKTIGLHELRKRISIIPQDPVLFSGTIRSNLDPFSEMSDDNMWSALEEVQLKKIISSMPGGLEYKILNGGDNFSMGERQLICLARAILRNNKILILDEATANVDLKTDELIQKTIRDKFSNCTVLTIAHRLNTVMTSDRILVISSGKLVEFDTPFNLAQKESGHFRTLLEYSDTILPA